ncbi:MAG: hypothetical protein H6737_13295 [Alphaproteobacteria bacterium]|nr:hypothetical protein [Alphaproteobacteria bacterium]
MLSLVGLAWAGPFTHAAFSPDASMVAVHDGLAKTRAIHVHATESRARIAKLACDCEHLGAFAFSPDGRFLAGVGGHEIRVWRTADWALVGSRDEPGLAASVAWGDGALFVGSIDGRILRFASETLPDPQVRREPHVAHVAVLWTERGLVARLRPENTVFRRALKDLVHDASEVVLYATDGPTLTAVVPGPATGLRVGPGGRTVVADVDALLGIAWTDPPRVEPLSRGPSGWSWGAEADAALVSARFLHDGSTVAVARHDDALVARWSAPGRDDRDTPLPKGNAAWLDVSPDGRWVWLGGRTWEVVPVP